MTFDNEGEGGGDEYVHSDAVHDGDCDGDGDNEGDGDSDSDGNNGSVKKKKWRR